MLDLEFTAVAMAGAFSVLVALELARMCVVLPLAPYCTSVSYFIAQFTFASHPYVMILSRVSGIYSHRSTFI